MVDQGRQASDRPEIAVVGAGLIGRKHIELVKKQARLSAVVDPAPEVMSVANENAANWFADLRQMLELHRPDGVIIATPNQLHAEQARLCIEAGIPVLLEKPIADRSDAAAELVAVSLDHDVPILVGHHRRHNPLIKAAKSCIEDGRLGSIMSVNAQFWLYKPDDYFNTDWRTRKGAGPVFINLIHDIDLLRYLCGEITAVQAMESLRAPNFEVEDTAAILLEFDNGALGTVNVSDTIVAPWSWEFTAQENPAYPHAKTSCYTIGGSEASLSLPDMGLWRHPHQRSWWEPIERTNLAFDPQDPLALQLEHFIQVIAGEAEPLVSGSEGLQTLRVVEAIKDAATSGQKLYVDRQLAGTG